jgi:ATP-binding cassette subfamily C protein
MMTLIMAGFISAVILLSTPGPAFLSLILTGVSLFVIVRIFQTQFRRIGETIRREVKQMIKSIQHGFGAFVDARIIGCEDHLSKAHRESLIRYAKFQRRNATMHKVTPYAIETFMLLSLLIILFLLILSEGSSGAGLPIISLLVVAVMRLKQLSTKIASSINAMNRARAFIPGVVRDMHELNALESRRRAKASEGQMIKTFHALRLVHVTYTYPNTESPAIQDISFELNRGESVAFVGTTGCGKSTIINLILGLLEPHTGQITVNGIDTYQDMKGWRKLLGYIPQSIYLLDDTIQANVAFGISENDINQEYLWEALRSARLEDFVIAQPNGLSTLVGERGVRLSGGQRQRLGIARALYQNPEVLVMDEATSALDNTTEEMVMQAIQNLRQNRTLIMVAHRLSTIEDCERLYFMNQGKIECVGTFEELIRSSEDFWKMARGASNL